MIGKVHCILITLYRSLMTKPAITDPAIPKEQQPLNQYQELADSFFSRWPAQDLRSYLKGIAAVWSGTLLITATIASSSFPPDRELGHWLISAGVGSNLLLTLILIRLYLGWLYVRARLLNPEVLYEESGWYDGAVSAKSQEELLQHQLIVQHQIKPILRRLHRTFLWILSLSGTALLLWPWV